VLRRLRIENLVLIRAADLELSPGLNALTGETGAGKTIFAQAIGLLLGTKGDAASVGPAGAEAYVEAELDVPEGFFDDEELAALAELRPEDEAGIVLARRVFGDGRTRAYAWGRAVAREDLAAAAERLISMSGQFQQRRLARPSYQLDVLDAFCGAEQAERRHEARVAWRDLGAARKRHEELTRDADAVAARLAELHALVEDTDSLAPGEEERLRAERERVRHVAELGAGAEAAARAVAPDDGEGAAVLAAVAEKAIAPLERLAPELERPAAELRDIALRLGEVGSELRRFVASLEVDPERIEATRRPAGAFALHRRMSCSPAVRRRGPSSPRPRAVATPPRRPRTRWAKQSCGSRGRFWASETHGCLQSRRSPRPSRTSCGVSGWMRASSTSRSRHARRERPAPTTSPS
jgi:DNA repair protein RecN (Recombination protein N)